jgi:hypothetical protein
MLRQGQSARGGRDRAAYFIPGPHSSFGRAVLNAAPCQWGSAQARAPGRLLRAPGIAIRPARESAREPETHDEVRHDSRGCGWRSHGYTARRGHPWRCSGGCGSKVITCGKQLQDQGFCLFCGNSLPRSLLGTTRSYSTPACELSPGLWRAVAVFSLKNSPARELWGRRSVAPGRRSEPVGASSTTAYRCAALAVVYDFL